MLEASSKFMAYLDSPPPYPGLALDKHEAVTPSAPTLQAASIPFVDDPRPWECQYCGLKCTYEEGEKRHWPTCPKFPEPCPNSCEVGKVERCNLEQHRSECSLEPVACEMKEFGCSVVVPRKELARHMRESELQHLTAMTMLNLCLTKQLQRKISEQKRDVKRIEHATSHIQKHDGQFCSVCDAFTFKNYIVMRKCSGMSDQCAYSDPFYSHHHGYKFRLKISYYSAGIGVALHLLKGEYDDKLHWPVKVKVQLELLNQAGDRHHVVREGNMEWNKVKKASGVAIDELVRYPEIEGVVDGICYMMNDCLKFRVHITIV